MRRQDYTVGWICAIQTEFVAACELLDEEHPLLPADSSHDDNAYNLGRIGEHYIVIACLPKGRYGIASAASVAKDMLRSFESIRIGLMVGIGGGAPSGKHDIRLGDIVVGCPINKEGGVVPYNFGKAVQDQEFTRTGSLNSPPTVLLTALTKLSADHERKGSHIAESVRSIMTKNPRLRGKYQHPGIERDRLYNSRYTHRKPDDGCEICCDSTSPPLLQRPPREVDPDEPVVHYGLIASADKLMKDATVRDQLIKEHDVLCFEMEAAGLMNDFPCVVIRGICDYSDSHKNDAWQGYAAVTAALYAKELLNTIPKHHVARIQTATAEMVKPLFSVPYQKDNNFIDRKDIFSQIEGQLQVHHRVSLCGLGGVGKSQIAIEYAYRFQQSHPQSHVFWVYAASYATFLQACHGIARSLKLPACDEPQTNPCELVSEWLNEDDHSWLMILDNADNAELFSPPDSSELPRANSTQIQRSLGDYLPSILNPQKSVLVTTRSRLVGQDLAQGGLCVEVPPLSSREAMDFLQSKVTAAVDSFDMHMAKRLLDVLGCNPLAITQAAAFMDRKRMTIQTYLADLERDEQSLADYLSHELQDPRKPRGFHNSVFRTCKLTFDQILKQEPQTAKLLSLMAKLDTQRIPEKLLRRAAETEVDFRMAIGTLDGFALISQETGGQTYAMHPLVQASVHYWLGQSSEFNHRSSRSYRQSVQDPSSSKADQTTNRNTSPQDTQVTRDPCQLEHNGDLHQFMKRISREIQDIRVQSHQTHALSQVVNSSDGRESPESSTSSEGSNYGPGALGHLRRLEEHQRDDSGVRPSNTSFQFKRDPLRRYFVCHGQALSYVLEWPDPRDTSCGTRSSLIFTQKYASPRIMKVRTEIRDSADLFSLGCVFSDIVMLLRSIEFSVKLRKNSPLFLRARL